jgi:cytoskeletal protein RodZ
MPSNFVSNFVLKVVGVKVQGPLFHFIYDFDICQCVAGCCTYISLLEMCHLWNYLLFIILQHNVDRIKVENETDTVSEEDPRCVDSNDTDTPSALSVQETVPEVSWIFFIFLHLLTTTTAAAAATTTTTTTTTAAAAAATITTTTTAAAAATTTTTTTTTAPAAATNTTTTTTLAAVVVMVLFVCVYTHKYVQCEFQFKECS